MNTYTKVIKWVLLMPLIMISLVVLTFVGWNVAKGIAPDETCKLYKSMVHSMAAPGFMPSDDCRWVKRDPIGHYTVNGVPFTVPRAYLWQGGHDPDGLYDALYMMMRYPDMQAVLPDQQALEVQVTVHSTARHVLCVNEGKCDQISQSKYWYMSGLEWCEQGRESCKYKNGAPETINFIRALGLNYFKGGFGTKDVFIKGEVLRPDLWFVCDPLPGYYKNPSCESVFQINEQVYVRYLVRREALGGQLLDVHEKVVSKLEEFLNKSISVTYLQDNGE